MRKFKIISTCASLILMVALMAFGVYAAASSFTLSVSGTISFKCTDVYIKVTYGIVGGTTYGPYSSQPGDTLSWKDESGNVVSFNTFANNLPDMTFTETADTSMPSCTYFITVENLHGMDIGLSLGYKWANNKKDNEPILNPITATNKLVASKNLTDDEFGEQIEDKSDGVVYIASEYVFAENSTRTLFVTLTLDNEEYVAGGNIQMALSAAVNVGEVPAITF